MVPAMVSANEKPMAQAYLAAPPRSACVRGRGVRPVRPVQRSCEDMGVRDKLGKCRPLVTFWLLVGCGRVGFGTTSDTPTDAASQLQCNLTEFSGGLPATWAAWSDGPGFTAAVVGEQLAIQLAPNMDGYAGVKTQQAVDLTGSSVVVEVPSVVSPTNGESYLAVFVDNQNSYLVSCSTQTLVLMRKEAGTVTRMDVPYDPSLHRYWRIAHDVGSSSVVFLTSQTGTSWIQ